MIKFKLSRKSFADLCSVYRWIQRVCALHACRSVQPCFEVFFFSSLISVFSKFDELKLPRIFRVRGLRAIQTLDTFASSDKCVLMFRRSQACLTRWNCEEAPLCVVIVCSTGVLQQFYTLNCSGLKPISYV